jgi:hypothetical protein
LFIPGFETSDPFALSKAQEDKDKSNIILPEITQ